VAPRSLRRWKLATRNSGLLRYIDRDVLLTLPKALGVTRGNHAQAEQYYENPQKIWLAFHLLPPPSRQLRTLIAALLFYAIRRRQALSRAFSASAEHCAISGANRPSEISTQTSVRVRTGLQEQSSCLIG
jgi:hypothetical protein